MFMHSDDIPAGVSIGYHTHEDTEEAWFLASGRAILTYDGNEFEMTGGDISLCKKGHSHDFLYLEGLSITGSEGVAVTRPSINLTKVGLSENPEGAGLKDVVPPECQKMYDHFAECIEQNKQPSCSLDEGYKSLRLVRAIYKSMETGLPVDPNEVDF